MTLGIYNSAAFINASGVANIASVATVEVRRESDGGLADIYYDRDGMYPIPQPGFAADSDGYFEFYAAGLEDGYQVRVTSGPLDITLRYQPVGNARYLDAGAAGASVLAAEDVLTILALIGAASLTVENQLLSGGATPVPKDLGVMESGELIVDPGDCPFQTYINDGDHLLSTDYDAYGSCVVDIINGSGAGIITVDGTGQWDRVIGDSFTTYAGDAFRCFITVGPAGTMLIVRSMP